ncbi:MAG: phosphate signaling complex protein PhoU [Nitriliruptoraceae bacterium]|nr:phosphate signaling complex protein PhoU [Nitriliruptoraceae bacterium]
MRTDLDLQIDQLRTTVVAMGERTDAMLADALRALADADLNVADLVIEADVDVDRAYEQVQRGVLAVVALHGPVGRDLRLLTSLIHVSLHLERMGDYAAGVARTIKRAAEHPGDADLTEQLVEMGDLAREVARTALQAFLHDDVELANRVASLDDGVDRLNVGIFHRLVRLASQDEHRLAWATRMIQLTRQLERFADHGVDVAEQAVFVTTGDTVELSGRRA